MTSLVDVAEYLHGDEHPEPLTGESDRLARRRNVRRQIAAIELELKRADELEDQLRAMDRRADAGCGRASGVLPAAAKGTGGS
jgi:hypothetical protein